jgi:hypothetical protein
MSLAQESGDASVPAAQVHGFDTDLLMVKTPGCACCTSWAEHVDHSGLSVTTRESLELMALKAQMGIDPRYQSCHTAIWHDHPYVFEGHVPARLIQQFVAAPPAGAIGLSVPGMPLGSPGMEVGGIFNPYDVMLLMEDGSATVYESITSAEQQ